MNREVLAKILETYFKEDKNIKNDENKDILINVLVYLLDKAGVNLDFEFNASVRGEIKYVQNEYISKAINSNIDTDNEVLDNVNLKYEILSILDYIKCNKPNQFDNKAWIYELQRIAFYDKIKLTKNIDNLDKDAQKLYSSIIDGTYVADNEYKKFVNESNLFKYLANNASRDIQEYIECILEHIENKKRKNDIQGNQEFSVDYLNGSYGAYIPYSKYYEIESAFQKQNYRSKQI